MSIYIVSDHYINFDVDMCLANRHFCNKIWQACRYTLSWASKLEQESCSLDVLPSGLNNVPINRWILSRLDHFVNRVNENLSTTNFHTVMLAIKQFLYFDFCDIYLVSMFVSCIFGLLLFWICFTVSYTYIFYIVGINKTYSTIRYLRTGTKYM